MFHRAQNSCIKKILSQSFKFTKKKNQSRMYQRLFKPIPKIFVVLYKQILKKKKQY